MYCIESIYRSDLVLIYLKTIFFENGTFSDRTRDLLNCNHKYLLTVSFVKKCVHCLKHSVYLIYIGEILLSREKNNCLRGSHFITKEINDLSNNAQLYFSDSDNRLVNVKSSITYALNSK